MTSSRHRARQSPPVPPAPNVRNDRETRLSRARDYPYAIPRESYVYRVHGVDAFDPALTRGRAPVLAIGSNQSPVRLAQKFGPDASHVIPVQRARLEHFDIVYSAHLSSYGAVPAMLQVSEGSVVTLMVTWLDEAQLEIMHESEVSAANYAYAELNDVCVQFDDGRTHERAFVYVSRRGSLRDSSGEAIALRAIACKRRRFRSMTTTEVLEEVRMRVESRLGSDEFVERVVADPIYRRQVSDSIARDADAFGHPARLLL